MDVIQAARQLGKVIQADERFKKLETAKAANEADKELQDEIGDFNLKRVELNAEVQKSDKDSDKIKELDAELKKMYAKIFKNSNMVEFTEAKRDMEEMIAHINKIVGGSASGLDPDGIDPYEVACGGDCGGCSGCS